MSRAVLFDLDGTLTDSRPGIFACFRFAFARLAEDGGPKVELPGDEGLRFIVGPPLRDSFERFADAAYKERLMAYYRERYQPIGAFENSVYPGAAAALERLAAAGARLLVATSKNEADARRILEHFGLAGRFEAIFGARADGTRSQKRELIGDALKAHAIAPEAAVMIGDREFDMIGASALGVRAIGALWGYGSAEELRDAGADALAASPEEAAEIALRR